MAVTENELAPVLVLGSIFLWAFDTAPEGCAFCDGTILRINENSPLYTILVVKFGGNGTTTFALPDLTKAEKKLKRGQVCYLYRGYLSGQVLMAVFLRRCWSSLRPCWCSKESITPLLCLVSGIKTVQRHQQQAIPNPGCP
ncbi:MAG: tail fiber protein [Chitinophagaceae bacterium]|nr:tail fiber protein [Chitinophagaceae bacterium]